MNAFDRAVLAERTMTVERHLQRVADAVILHLWQATQIVIDLAMSACLSLNLGTPSSYADAFRRLERAGVVEGALAGRLVRAAGFRNVVAHAYDTLDMRRVHEAARNGPADLRAFLVTLRDRRPPEAPASTPPA